MTSYYPDEITSWSAAYDLFDNYIDEATEPIEILGLTMAPHTVLRECDPTAYRCYFNDWADAEGIDTDELTGYPERH